jgi:uncharacterized protein YutE (UPF0331/DUF86 family)
LERRRRGFQAIFGIAIPKESGAKPRDLRNRIVHKYWDLDLEVIWSTVQEDIPKLRAAAAAILEAEYPPDV